MTRRAGNVIRWSDMKKIIKFYVREVCEHDGCYAKPEVIFIYENYPLQLCRGCFDNFANVLRSNKAWSRRLKSGAIYSPSTIQSDVEFPF
jgi:hypothetical protein